MKLKINLELLIFVLHSINSWIILKFPKLEHNVVYLQEAEFSVPNLIKLRSVIPEMKRVGGYDYQLCIYFYASTLLTSPLYSQRKEK